MTYAPATLKALGAYWVANGGVNLGVVGDTAHAAKGVSYHLGESQLTSTAYSRQTTRDRAGLSDGASAIDLGRLHGSLPELRKFSNWLISYARRNLPGTSDMREIIYSPDGKIVLRWDRQRGYASSPRGGEADTSHLTHTHISWYRDAERRDHTTAFRPYFTTAPSPTPPPGGGTVEQFITYAKPKTAVVPKGTWIYDNEACATSAGNIQIDPGRDMPLAGKLANGILIVGYVDTTPTETEVKTYFAKQGTVTLKDAVGAPAPDSTPFDQADLDAAVDVEHERIAAAEADRIRAV